MAGIRSFREKVYLMNTICYSQHNLNQVAAFLPLLPNHMYIKTSNTTVTNIPPYTKIASIRCLR